MDIVDTVNGFQFNNDGVVHKKIEPIPFIELKPVILNWKALLPLYLKSISSKFKSQTGFVS